LCDDVPIPLSLDVIIAIARVSGNSGKARVAGGVSLMTVQKMVGHSSGYQSGKMRTGSRTS
jgi:hypothetical protein